ncbi:Dabb family protein [Parahaliea maris]|uniref:Dabb family protein n=1 Tax=Parahaliea maris TaxID=2716870 RepID=A0A5C9A6Z2_9GAMM|nr:Dabb family protein [Parahaliea maris]TXS95859.1 Dabb family protein [Parahaliea maris]
MTITVLDQIVVAPDELAVLETLLETRYLPGAAARGLQLQSKQVSPPVITAEGPLTLWLRWEVADAGAWWGMRAQSGCPEVYTFWDAVDGICLSRKRTYLTGQSAAELPAVGEPVGCTTGVRFHRETAQLALAAAEKAEALEALLSTATEDVPGLEQAVLGRNLAPEYAAGHYTWDLLFTDGSAAQTARESRAWREMVLPALAEHCRAVHAFALDYLGGGLRAPGISGGVKRTAYFRLLPGTAPEAAANFERDLLEMPRHMPAIVNWRLSRALPAAWNRSDVPPWTYVWEQDFADVGGLTGPYMTHPHHWAHIDRWFDPESGDQIVDVQISHAFCSVESSVLANELLKGER